MSFRNIIAATFIFAVFFTIWNYSKSREILSACDRPIEYGIGTFDRRFGISYQTFLSALAEAEAILEKPIGKELFMYSPESDELAVNLIYDYRQETTGVLSSLENVVTKDEVAYRTLRSKYVSLKAEYENVKSIYNAQIELFNEKNSDYEQRVKVWNRGKRTSNTELEQLETARLALENEATELKLLETRLNQMVNEINHLVGLLNNLVKSLNLNVEAYNTIGALRGETFVGGVYQITEDVQEINVYEFSNRDKLVKVLAHELGHALGLEHVDDHEAIMYELNEGHTKVLSKTDFAALKTLCKTD
ncbi:MAG: matrixin family metalloprotease [Patescibacteria group bacterium]